MHKKPLLSAIIAVLFMSILFGYSLVFGATGSYNGPVKIDYISGKNIYTSDFELNQTRILFRSGVDLSENKIISSCETYSKMKYKKKDLYYFELKYFTPCEDNKISLVDKNGKELYSGNLEVTTEYDLYDKFVDYSSDNIKNIQQFLSSKILKLSKQKLSNNVLTRAKQQRELKEAQYMQDFLQDLLKQRTEKYLVPVAGYNIATQAHKIPNAARPYRASYTDGIHH
jgi:5'(3')-deoxyribonucleotidase